MTICGMPSIRTLIVAVIQPLSVAALLPLPARPAVDIDVGFRWTLTESAELRYSIGPCSRKSSGRGPT